MAGFGTDCDVEISFKSVPDGATVRDESQGKLGTTPFVRTFKSEINLNLTYSKEGYEEKKKSFYNVTSPLLVMLELQKSPLTYIFVKTNPPGATIEFQTIDGSKLTLPQFSRIEGRQESSHLMYKVEDNINRLVVIMSKNGYKTRRETVSIDAKKDNLFTFPLEKVSAELNIISNPPGAEVYEKTLGFLGQTPLTKEVSWDEMRRLSIGKDIDTASVLTMHFTISKTDYKSEELVERFPLDRENLARTINVTLADEVPLKLMVNSNPTNADVYEKSLGFLGKTPLSRIISANDLARLTHRENNDAGGSISCYLLITKGGYTPVEHKKVLSLKGYNDSVQINLDQK